jgi:hypothetical protein
MSYDGFRLAPYVDHHGPSMTVYDHLQLHVECTPQSSAGDVNDRLGPCAGHVLGRGAAHGQPAAEHVRLGRAGAGV